MTHLKRTPMTQRLSIAIVAIKKSEMRHVFPGLRHQRPNWQMLHSGLGCLCNHDNDERKASVDALVARSGYYT